MIMTEYRILIVNPNSSQSMTDALRPVVEGLGYTSYSYFTAPDGPVSINSTADIEESTSASLAALQSLLPTHSAVLIACYSAHPLVPALRHWLANHADPEQRRKPVLGIFEASVAAALQVCGTGIPGGGGSWGIISTGKVWEELLTNAVTGGSMGTEGEGHGVQLSGLVAGFMGVETTGLSAAELHEADPQLVKTRVKEAVTRLLGRRENVTAVLLGCAGMAGMEGWVAEAVAEYGAQGVSIIDGVKAGVGALQGWLRAGF
ncbi:hypothetical protein BD410DRAFT_754926 [Rickenella mellea]|uniref:DCG1-like protein n=1 Tax=Rickenella mellea TaxID=50990 RepID=A0A4Y7PPJ6_9AGAM|nr:hypothetical protein BD410DRAFT_754926 [Rickenella mellea]